MVDLDKGSFNGTKGQWWERVFPDKILDEKSELTQYHLYR